VLFFGRLPGLRSAQLLPPPTRSGDLVAHALRLEESQGQSCGRTGDNKLKRRRAEEAVVGGRLAAMRATCKLRPGCWRRADACTTLPTRILLLAPVVHLLTGNLI